MSYLGGLIHVAAWAHGNQLRKREVADEVAAEIARELGPSDDEIRALVKSVAQATLELVAERVAESRAPFATISGLYLKRHDVADEMADTTMECADEDPESEVHAMRRMR